MTLVEKVADTMHGKGYGLTRAQSESIARAALAVVFEALREPTPAMIQAAVDRPHSEDLIYAAIWRAMLASAEREAGDG